MYAVLSITEVTRTQGMLSRDIRMLSRCLDCSVLTTFSGEAEAGFSEMLSDDIVGWERTVSFPIHNIHYEGQGMMETCYFSPRDFKVVHFKAHVCNVASCLER